MKKALFTSKNLVGDGLCISAALRKWHELHPEYEIDLLTDMNGMTQLYFGMGVPLQVRFEVFKDDGHSLTILGYPYDFEHVFDVSKAFAICDREKCHMAQGYAADLGVDIGDDIGPFYEAPIVAEDQLLIDSVPDDVILIAPFSRSCTSHDGKPPNKTLPKHKWMPILAYLRRLGKQIRVTGSEGEPTNIPGISDDEYLLGFPLRPLARVLRDKTFLLVTVDNGISHLGGSQKVPQVLFYPLCLGLHYAVPWSNPFVMPIHMDPAMAETAQLTWCTKQSVEMIEKIKRGEVVQDA
jgi:ADP-heptose:LPS heptosyltransferase